MSKLGLIAGLLSIAGVLTFATFTASADDAPAPCIHTEFKTELVKAACAKGGQPQARTAMKAFMKDKKIKSCRACHEKLAPRYELKKDGLEQFQKAGGK